MNGRFFVANAIVVIILINERIDALLNLNGPDYLSSIIYKCPLKPDPMHPDRLDQSIIVVNNNTLEDLMKSTTIIVRTDAKIMHQISFLADFDDYAFYHASMADIEDIFEHTNTSSIQNQHGRIVNQTNLYNEEILNEYEYNQLKNFSSFNNRVYEIQDNDMINKEIYKCIGNSIPYSQYFSVFIVLKRTPLTSMYRVGDIIFSSKSFGYLENITAIDTIETSHGNKIIIKTNLTQCGNYLNSIFGNIIRRDEADTNSSELDCSGDSISKLYVMNKQSLNINLNSTSIGKLIPGRQSSSFGIHILAKQVIGEYIVYEGISIQNMDNSLSPKLSIHKEYSYRFSKTFGYDAVSGGKIYSLNLNSLRKYFIML